MKKYLKLILVVLALSVMIGGFAFWKMTHPSLSAIADFAPLWFPSGTKLISSNDDGEMSVRAHIQLDSDNAITDFLTQNKLEQKTNSADTFHLCVKTHSIDVKISRPDKVMALEVGYPDFGGTSPCP